MANERHRAANSNGKLNDISLESRISKIHVKRHSSQMGYRSGFILKKENAKKKLM